MKLRIAEKVAKTEQE